MGLHPALVQVGLELLLLMLLMLLQTHKLSLIRILLLLNLLQLVVAMLWDTASELECIIGLGGLRA